MASILWPWWANNVRAYKVFLVLGLVLLILLLVLRETRENFSLQMPFVDLNNKEVKAKSSRFFGNVNWTGTRDVLPPCGSNSPEYPPNLFNSLGLNASICDQTALIDVAKLYSLSWPYSLDGAVAGKTDCPRKAIPAPMTLPSTGLTTWPGSGNTWTRHLIEQLTGIQSGAVYNDPGLKMKGFLGEGKTKGVIVIKTHFTALPLTKILNFDRQIVVLRNPFDALAAEYKRGPMKAGHNKKVEIVPDANWKTYVRERIETWSYFVRTCLAFRHSQLIVMYEDMKSPCLARELLQIANFLRTAKLTKFSLCCSLTHSVGKSYRNQTQVPVRQLYEGQLLTDMNAMLTDLAQDVSSMYPVLSKRLLDYRLL